VFAIEKGHFNIFQRCRARQEIEALKNKPDFFIANFRERVAVHLTDVNAIEQIPAGSRLIQASNHVHKGGFTRAGWSHHGNKFS
jgi:hypothetical protein